MAVCFDDMIPDVRTHLSGAPEDTCIHYLRRGAQQFCQDSRKWIQSLGTDELDPLTGAETEFEIAVPGAPAVDATDTTPAIPAGPFQLPDESKLNSIAKATFEGDDIPEIAYDEITEIFTFPARTVLQTGTLEIYGVMEPSDDSEEVPNAIGRYRKTIADHAIYEMGMMPNQHWTMAPRAAHQFLRSYRRRVAEATVDRARKGANRRVRTAPPPFV